jgi:hypothetical protein
MSRLADDCCERVLKGETMYIHCWSVMRAEGAGGGVCLCYPRRRHSAACVVACVCVCRGVCVCYC